MKTYVSFEINEKFYEIEKADNGFTLTVDSNEKYLLPSYELSLEFLLLLIEAYTEDEEQVKMLEKTFFHEQYELEGLTESEDIEDYDSCDYEIGFNPYLGCYDYDC